MVITSDDLSNLSPTHKATLRRQKKLRANVKECLAIENAPLGIAAAKAARCVCAAVQTALEAKYLFQADFIAKDLGFLKSHFYFV